MYFFFLNIFLTLHFNMCHRYHEIRYFFLLCTISSFSSSGKEILTWYYFQSIFFVWRLFSLQVKLAVWVCPHFNVEIRDRNLCRIWEQLYLLEFSFSFEMYGCLCLKKNHFLVYELWSMYQQIFVSLCNGFLYKMASGCSYTFIWNTKWFQCSKNWIIQQWKKTWNGTTPWCKMHQQKI